MHLSAQSKIHLPCLQTDDLELKKLVYLYLINYAKTQPDLAIMGVNTFVKVHKTPRLQQA